MTDEIEHLRRINALLLAALKAVTLDYALRFSESNEPAMTRFHPFIQAREAIREAELELIKRSDLELV